MQKTLFKITKMDCPSEENMIRIKLDYFPEVKTLEFDIPNRKLAVIHEGNIEGIKNAITSLNLGGKLLKTEHISEVDFKEQTNQQKLLWAVLSINFAFFIIEITTGYISRSMGLIADSLDMLADSFVYGISLFAVGGTLARKKNIAKLAGYFQILLAIIGFAEAVKRFTGIEKIPDFATMILISVLALTANAICLYLLQRSKSKEAHMRASMIFTSNDVIINLGVIIAGLLVNWLDSNKPDLIVGGIVFILVIQGAFRILKLVSFRQA
ncbi:MAG: cation transporter [Desulfobacteraceae bacterium]|jgi:Co/Zn/Cd efflux system component